jgi:hypothetical protein
MGWWKIESPETGGIDFDHDTGSSLVNAISGRDSIENYYNGDEPANLMDEARASLASLQLSLLADEVRSAFFLGKGNTYAVEVFATARKRISEVYLRDWGREPYDEEWKAVFNFGED